MKLLKFIFFFCFLSFFIISNSFSASVELKTGRIVEGEIVKVNDRFLRIRLESGVEVTYYPEEIERVLTSLELAKIKSENLKKEEKSKPGCKNNFQSAWSSLKKLCISFFSKENFEKIKSSISRKFDTLVRKIRNSDALRPKRLKSKTKKMDIRKFLEKRAQRRSEDSEDSNDRIIKLYRKLNFGSENYE